MVKRSRLIILLVFTFYSLVSSSAEEVLKPTSLVYQSYELSMTTDNKLINAVAQLLNKHPDLQINHHYNQACLSKNYIVNAFKNTFGKNDLSNAQSYKDSTKINGLGYFQIARFIITEKSQQQNLLISLKKAKNNRLQVKENVRYHYFTTDHEIVFMISSGSYEQFNANQSLFNELAGYFNANIR